MLTGKDVVITDVKTVARCSRSSSLQGLPIADK